MKPDQNMVLYGGLGALALVGAYYFYSKPETRAAVKEATKKD